MVSPCGKYPLDTFSVIVLGSIISAITLADFAGIERLVVRAVRVADGG